MTSHLGILDVPGRTVPLPMLHGAEAPEPNGSQTIIGIGIGVGGADGESIMMWMRWDDLESMCTLVEASAVL